MTMNAVQREGLEGTSKLPICQKCFDKPALFTCSKCGVFLCADCQKTHVCEEKKEETKN